MAAGLVVLTGPAARSADEGPTVHMAGYRYEPAGLTVRVGTTVEWVNDDVAGHDVRVVRFLIRPELDDREVIGAVALLLHLEALIARFLPARLG